MTPTIKIRNFYRTYCMHIRSTLFLFFFSLFVSFCDAPSSPDHAKNLPRKSFMKRTYSFPYKLNHPDATYKLPSYLEEISGLAYCKENKLVCVQDEKANIYVLELGNEPDISTFKFGKNGDFEDIAMVDQTAYVLRNDGRIYRVKEFTSDRLKVKKFKTPLSEKNNTEGMTYDETTHSLLIACKASPSIEQDNPFKGKRAVYRFDLNKEELVSAPYLLIDLDDLDRYSDKSTFTRFSSNLAKKLRLVDSETSFKPSGLGIHPLSGDIYLISSIGKLLVIMDRQGNILEIQEFDDKLFRQPEGICFSPSGDLFISNEGKGGKGYILGFKLLKDE